MPDRVRHRQRDPPSVRSRQRRRDAFVPPTFDDERGDSVAQHRLLNDDHFHPERQQQKPRERDAFPLRQPDSPSA